jgi:hypothetical protein
MKACFHWVFRVLAVLDLIAFFVELVTRMTAYARDYRSVPVFWGWSAGESLVFAILFGLIALWLKPRRNAFDGRLL